MARTGVRWVQVRPPPSPHPSPTLAITTTTPTLPTPHQDAEAQGLYNKAGFRPKASHPPFMWLIGRDRMWLMHKRVPPPPPAPSAPVAGAAV